MIIEDAVAAAAVPIYGRRAQRRKEVGVGVMSRVGVDLRDEDHPDDHATTATAEV